MDQCCDEWDLNGDCDVDKEDYSLLKLRQKAEKTSLKAKHKIEKMAIKGSYCYMCCDNAFDLNGDCDVDKDDAKLLKLRQKLEKTDFKGKHKAEKVAMKAAL